MMVADATLLGFPSGKLRLGAHDELHGLDTHWKESHVCRSSHCDFPLFPFVWMGR
jgi:hypothetical protein